MNKKLMLKIIIIYFVINCLLFLLMEHMVLFAVISRIFLFCIVGILVGIYVFNKDKELIKGNILYKNFGRKAFVFFFLLLVYSAYNMGNDILIFCERGYAAAFGNSFYFSEPFQYPLMLSFIYDSFFSSFALFNYLLSYFLCGLTIFILSKRKIYK